MGSGIYAEIEGGRVDGRVRVKRELTLSTSPVFIKSFEHFWLQSFSHFLCSLFLFHWFVYFFTVFSLCTGYICFVVCIMMKGQELTCNILL